MRHRSSTTCLVLLAIVTGCASTAGQHGADPGATRITPAAASRNPAGDKADETPHGPLDPAGETRGIKNPN